MTRTAAGRPLAELLEEHETQVDGLQMFDEHELESYAPREPVDAPKQPRPRLE